jgi:hypothetical protein
LPISISRDFNTFNFVSYGKKGIIYKRIMFTPTEDANIYDLAFGDVNEEGELNDNTISDNGDRNKVLATVAAVLARYLKKFPDRTICFEGSTPQRTRLYRMAISLHLEALSKDFDIYHKENEDLLPFDKNMIIKVFVIKKK